MPRRRRPPSHVSLDSVSVDFSANSRAALRYGAALARRSHGSLAVLFVNDPLLVAAAAAAYDARTLARTCDRNFAALFRKHSGRRRSHSRSHSKPPSASRRRRSVRVAQRRRCDLIVMGTQGLSGPSKWFFGSVTQGRPRRAKVPVLAIPAGHRGIKALASGARSWPGPRLSRRLTWATTPTPMRRVLPKSLGVSGRSSCCSTS